MINSVQVLKQRKYFTLHKRPKSIALNSKLFVKKNSFTLPAEQISSNPQYQPRLCSKIQKKRTFQQFVLNKEDIQCNQLLLLKNTQPSSFFLSCKKKFKEIKHPRIHSTPKDRRIPTEKALREMDHIENVVKRKSLSSFYALDKYEKKRLHSEDKNRGKKFSLKLKHLTDKNEEQKNDCGPWTKRDKSENEEIMGSRSGIQYQV